MSTWVTESLPFGVEGFGERVGSRGWALGFHLDLEGLGCKDLKVDLDPESTKNHLLLG